MKMRLILTLALCAPTLAIAEDVTVETFVRAESDYNIRSQMEAFGYALGELHHLRDPIAPDNQPTIRMNQDTLYSALVLDLSEPVEVTLARNRRPLSVHACGQSGSLHVRRIQARNLPLTEEEVGTRFAVVSFRTFVDVSDPDDIAKAHAAQDAILVSGGGKVPYETPDWDLEALGVARKALSDIAVLGFNADLPSVARMRCDPSTTLLAPRRAGAGCRARLPPMSSIAWPPMMARFRTP
jgi:hypothetical protein